MTTAAAERCCSVCARPAGLDPAGSVGTDDQVSIAVELPLPTQKSGRDIVRYLTLRLAR